MPVPEENINDELNIDPELNDNQSDEALSHKDNDAPKLIHLSGMFKNWFLDYASYVILERAVPNVLDGLKPVQRRIMHSLKELDDGRFNKAANVIGNTMKYHPHGDASIGDAMVQLGQKELLIDTQGNWGNILTGDSAAAPRYIEARLSKFALDVMFNPKITDWQLSYDGRNKEPVALPVKFPLLLAQGVEGIAVGLTSKILPHNFIELIDASIDCLKGVETTIYPDFPTGGLVDISKYNDGARGSRVRVRAKINQNDKKTLTINEIPFGTNTTSLIESIISANDKGKIKIKKIDDNTAQNVEIVIHLAPGVSPDTTIDALYAFTNCEISISPTCCVIDDHKPRFIDVKEILKISVQNTLDLLRKELEIERAEALEQWHFASLERIFIEKEVYERMKKCKTDAEINTAIDTGLKPFVKNLVREVTLEDILRLRKIPIDRISKYNSDKAEDVIKAIEDDIEQINYDLEHLVECAIKYYERIKNKYGKGRERKTEIKNFDNIEAALVAVANEKLYVNREEGFIGTALKKDEFVCECSDIDDIIAFREDGNFQVVKVNDKVFVGKNIIYVGVFKKNDERTIYNMIYQDGKVGNIMVKRFAVVGITRDKEYCLTKGSPNSKVLYFTANPNGEAEIVNVVHKPKPRLKVISFEFDFSTMAIKGRSSIGNILTRNPVRRITLKDEGVSTLGAREIWFDDTVNRLNVEQRGISLGAFEPEDKILAVMKSGHYRVYSTDLSNHFDEDIILIEKFDDKKIFSSIYFDAEQNFYFVKRFNFDFSDKKQCFISEAEGSYLFDFSKDKYPMVEVDFQVKKANAKTNEVINISEFIGVKSYKAKGKRLSEKPITSVKMLDPLPVPEEEAILEAEELLAAESESDEPEAEIEEVLIFEDKVEDTSISESEIPEIIEDLVEEKPLAAKKKSKKDVKPEELKEPKASKTSKTNKSENESVVPKEQKKPDNKDDEAGDGVQITLEF